MARRRVRRIGHRGAAALEPENTLRSLGRALELGVDLADASLVLAHSDDLSEGSHGATRGAVRTRTLSTAAASRGGGCSARSSVGALRGLRRTLRRRIAALLEHAGALAATLHWLVVSRAPVERCHERGAAVIAWTIDEPEVLRGLPRLGVDGVVSNDRRIFAATLSA